MNDRYYIKIIIRKIENQLNWSKVIFWTDNEYKKLSSLIHEDTSISISAQTLKRLFGKIKYKDDYKAQPATKDALARFLNYPNWDAFIADHRHSMFKFVPLIRSIKIGNTEYGPIALSLVVVILIISIIIALAGIMKKSIPFYAENVKGSVPHTVSIHYDISKFKNDVFINFDQNEAEDKSEGELLNKNLSLINHCFESPGYFNVKLSSKGKEVAATKVHVLSDGWSSYYFNNDNFSQRKFVFGLENRVQRAGNTGMLYISPAELNNKGFNGNTVYYLEHLLYSDFHVSADSCLLEVRYRNSSDIGGISCYDVEFRIIAENGLASVILVQKGCYRWSELTIGEKQINGKYNDLSFLTADLSLWNTMRILTHNNKVFMINNSDTIFTTSYNQLLGQIKGIRFVTKGSGAFDYVKMFNNSGVLVFDENFGN